MTLVAVLAEHVAWISAASCYLNLNFTYKSWAKEEVAEL